MLFTSQFFTTKQQAVTSCSTPNPVFAVREKNWYNMSVVLAPVGTPAERHNMPGTSNAATMCDRTFVCETLTQKLFTMKNARKQLGEMASNEASSYNPGPIATESFDTLPLFEHPIFHEKPQARQPEAPDTESFRSWLKSNTPHQKASPALLERIRSITHEDKA
jgi:hypothetical protein